MKAAMLRVRDLILGADPRLEGSLEWGVPTFSFRGNFASFNRSKKIVSLADPRRATILGDHRLLEGDGAHVRTIRFADLADVDARAAELQAVARARCGSRPA